MLNESLALLLLLLQLPFKFVLKLLLLLLPFKFVFKLLLKSQLMAMVATKALLLLLLLLSWPTCPKEVLLLPQLLLRLSPAPTVSCCPRDRGG